MKRRGRPNNLYIVYDNKTDFPICVEEPSTKCARLMHITVDRFYHIVNGEKSYCGKRWTVIKI